MSSKKTNMADIVSPSALKHNFMVLSYFRTFMAVISGAVVGILGVDGWIGFVPYLVCQLLCAVAMVGKGATQPKKYFGSWVHFLTMNVFASSTLLTFVLQWMIFFNITVVFT